MSTSKPKPILKADVLKKFSVRSLAALLNISRPAVDHWREFIPESQAAKLRETCPRWRRRPDFDPTPFQLAAQQAMLDRKSGKKSRKSGKKRAAQ